MRIRERRVVPRLGNYQLESYESVILPKETTNSPFCAAENPWGELTVLCMVASGKGI